jgi:hypothetical protein
MQRSSGTPARPVMLFKLTTSLSAPEIVAQPAINEVTKILSRLVRLCAHRGQDSPGFSTCSGTQFYRMSIYFELRHRDCQVKQERKLFRVALQVRNVVESTKPFVRWMDGSCIETPPQVGNPHQPPTWERKCSAQSVSACNLSHHLVYFTDSMRQERVPVVHAQ